MNDSTTLRQLARAFTRPVFSEMARSGKAQPALQFLNKVLHDGADINQNRSVGDAFDAGWTYLAKHYRNEYVYKNELATRLIFKRHSPRTASFQVELNVGRSIVDVAIANGTSTAYEIKTEFDTNRRLKTQTADYLKVFDKVFVVTHPNHVERYEKELDKRIGLIVLSQKRSLTPYREPTANSNNVDVRTIFKCLRRSEYLSAIKHFFGESPDLPNGLIANYCEKLFCTLSPQQAHTIFVSALRSRTTNKNNVDFVTLLPLSLRALGYGTPMSTRQRTTLLELLSSPVSLHS